MSLLHTRKCPSSTGLASIGYPRNRFSPYENRTLLVPGALTSRESEYLIALTCVYLLYSECSINLRNYIAACFWISVEWLMNSRLMKLLSAGIWLYQEYGPPSLEPNCSPFSLSLCCVSALGAIFVLLLYILHDVHVTKLLYSCDWRHGSLLLLLLARDFRVTELFSYWYLCHSDILLLLLMQDVHVTEIFFYCLSRHNDIILLLLLHNVCVMKLLSCMLLDVQRVVRVFIF